MVDCDGKGWAGVVVAKAQVGWWVGKGRLVSEGWEGWSVGWSLGVLVGPVVYWFVCDLRVVLTGPRPVIRHAEGPV